MTGGVAVRADPEALRVLADAGSALVNTFDGELRAVSELRAMVRARCGHRAAWGEGPELLQRLLTDLDDTAARTAEIRRELLAADTSTAGSPTGGHSLGPLIWPGDRATGGTSIPWLDPNTDSWVAGLFRTGTTGRPPRAFLERLRNDGPGLVADLTDTETSLANQGYLLLGDPDRFAANWRRAGAGIVDGTTAIGLSIVGLRALTTPGADDAIEAVTGQRPGAMFRSGVVDAGRALVYDPDSLVEATIGWDVYQEDPYYWFGTMLPEAALEGVTAAVPVSATRGALRVLPNQPPARPRASTVARGGAGDTGGHPPAAGPFPDLETYRRNEVEWGPVDSITSRRADPFESPEGWVEQINGEGVDSPGRNNNCIDCARAVEANWRGDDAVAAPLADPRSPGLSADHLQDWTGGRFQRASVDEIQGRLTELGPGSSAIVTSAWDTGGAHAYNALNDGGTVKWVDAQLGTSSPWPPPYADNVDDSIVIFIDPDGNPG